MRTCVKCYIEEEIGMDRIHTCQCGGAMAHPIESYCVGAVLQKRGTRGNSLWTITGVGPALVEMLSYPGGIKRFTRVDTIREFYMIHTGALPRKRVGRRLVL